MNFAELFFSHRGNVLAAIQDFTFGWVIKADKSPTERGLAAAGFADNTQRLARVDLEGDIIHRMDDTSVCREVFF